MFVSASSSWVISSRAVWHFVNECVDGAVFEFGHVPVRAEQDSVLDVGVGLDQPFELVSMVFHIMVRNVRIEVFVYDHHVDVSLIQRLGMPTPGFWGFVQIPGGNERLALLWSNGCGAVGIIH